MNKDHDKKKSQFESTELSDADLDKIAGGMTVAPVGVPLKVNEAEERAARGGGGGTGGGGTGGGRLP
jgi:hypothetical protein